MKVKLLRPPWTTVSLIHSASQHSFGQVCKESIVVLKFTCDPVSDAPSRIIIKRLSGQSEEVNIELSADVAALKQRIQSILGFEPSQQRLIIFPHGELFDDTATLQESRLYDGCFVHLVLRIRGAGSAVSFPDGESVEQMESWVAGAKEGMYVEGHCCNPSCSNLNRRVLAGLGTVAKFSLAHDVARCSDCSETLQLSTAGFVNCLWMFDGCQQDSVPQSSPWNSAPDRVYIRLSERNPTEWKQMILTALGPKGSRYVPEHCPESVCAICTQSFAPEDWHFDSVCNHRFHSSCVALLLSVAPESPCPICRGELRQAAGQW